MFTTASSPAEVDTGSAVSAYSSYVDVLNSTFPRNIASWGEAILSYDSLQTFRVARFVTIMRTDQEAPYTKAT